MSPAFLEDAGLALSPTQSRPRLLRPRRLSGHACRERPSAPALLLCSRVRLQRKSVPHPPRRSRPSGLAADPCHPGLPRQPRGGARLGLHARPFPRRHRGARTHAVEPGRHHPGLQGHLHRPLAGHAGPPVLQQSTDLGRLPAPRRPPPGSARRPSSTTAKAPLSAAYPTGSGRSTTPLSAAASAPCSTTTTTTPSASTSATARR